MTISARQLICQAHEHLRRHMMQGPIGARSYAEHPKCRNHKNPSSQNRRKTARIVCFIYTILKKCPNGSFLCPNGVEGLGCI